MWHSCSRYTLAHHFGDKPRELRRLFDHYLSVVRSFGPVTVIPQKSRIALQVRVRFAGAVVRNRWLECGFWLKRRAAHPLIHKVEVLLGRDFLHYFHLTKASQLDASLVVLLREAYDVGCQRDPMADNLKLSQRG
jgi:ABC-type antimicrobial peptide transport system ATPase subunit